MTYTTTLLSQANACLSALIDSAFLDATEMANDCLEVFDTYDWEAKPDLSDLDKVTWTRLLDKGNKGKLRNDELTTFLSLTNPEGQVHPYFHRIKARELEQAINRLNTPPEALPEKNAIDSMSFTLKDETAEDGDTHGYVENKHTLGLSLHFDGYSDCCSEDGYGTPVYIEKYDNDLRVIIYSDINQEEPTHVISLANAHIAKRESR